jgi:hypothetical protein
MDANMTKQPASRGRPHKQDDDKSDSYIHARCKSSDKAMWVKSAQAKKIKLTEWIIGNLNKCVDYEK